MFKKGQQKPVKPVSFGRPVAKPQRVTNLTDATKKISKALNNYELIREKVLDEAYTQPSKSSGTVVEKKKK